jgi:putative DNA primase/helicase
MANLKETGGFSINGTWITRIAYEADLDSGQLSGVQLRFIIGRSQIAQAPLTREEAREVLGDKNLAVIEQAAAERKEGTQERIKGELRGRTLHFRQATLPGDKPHFQDNTIERDSLSVEREQVEPAVEFSKAVPVAEERPSPSEPIETGATDMSALPAASPEARRLAQPRAIPEAIVHRFLRVDDQFYFPDRSLAFVDHGTSLKAATENQEVVRSLVAIAQARGWEAIRVNGTESFRRLIWREATRQDLPVRGYSPTDVERAEAERETGKHDLPAADSTATNEVRRESQERGQEVSETLLRRADNTHAGEPSLTKTRLSPGIRAAKTESVVGRLVEHGPAPYQFDEQKARSYFVKLDTSSGPRTHWGVDLERAFAESTTRPQVGDEIGVEFRGTQAVTVKDDVHDDVGRVIGHREVARHRNAWLVEKREYFDQRRMRAQALKDEGCTKVEVAQRHPELAGAVATIRVAELFAAKHLFAEADRIRFMKLVRDAMSRAIEHEAPLPVPKLRESRTRTPDREVQRANARIRHRGVSERDGPAMERG